MDEYELRAVLAIATFHPALTDDERKALLLVALGVGR